MNEVSPSPHHLRLRGFIFGLVPIAIMGVILFLSAGTVAWPAAWFVIGMIFLATLIVTITCHTDLVMERTRDQAGAKEYDKNLVRMMNLIGLLPLLVAGLDFRFGWTGQIALTVQAGAVVMFFFGYGLFSWAMIENRFFSLIVRIQEDKGHHPVTTGPYRFVRHPGYLGFILIILCQPLVLGSLWAFLPAILTAGLLVRRTDLEDGTLMLELEGYEEYAWKVRYRLVPGIW